jgi:hypothetical protein
LPTERKLLSALFLPLAFELMAVPSFLTRLLYSADSRIHC